MDRYTIPYGPQLSNSQIAVELGLDVDVAQTMTMALRRDIYARRPGCKLAEWGYEHKTVCRAIGEYASGFREVHVNTIEGFWSLPRSWLRPHRWVSQENLPYHLGFSNSFTTFGGEVKHCYHPYLPPFLALRLSAQQHRMGLIQIVAYSKIGGFHCTLHQDTRHCCTFPRWYGEDHQFLGCWRK